MSEPVHLDAWSRSIIDATPCAMLMIDPAQTIVLVNRGAEQLFGYTRDELLGRTLEMLLPVRFRDAHAAQVRGFVAAPRTRAMGAGREFYGRRKNGSEVPIEIGLNPLETPQGVFTIASIIDITERRRAETRFRVAVEAAPNAMILVDGSRRITLLNRATEALFGYPRSELIGRPIEMLVPDRFRDAHPDHIRGFFAAPAARAMGAGRELYGRRKDGSEVPIEIGLSPVETSEGQFVFASIIDITERKVMGAAHDRLAAIVEGSEDAILSKSLDGIITSWNAAAERLFGYTAADAIGQPVSMLIPERKLDEERDALQRIRRGDPLSHLETVRRHRDGREIQVAATLSPVRDAGRDIVGVASIVRDITAAKQRDAELQRSNAELEQFAYVASHDLQEPLRMVANYTELLAQRYRGRLDERADKYIHYASDGARRMQRLVADLLAYSRVGSQGRPLMRVASATAVAGALEALQRVVRESAATVEIGDLPEVLADEVQLQQLFQNLIGNALKFRSAAPPRIAIAAVPEGDRWTFSVADNGIGIEMQYADRIFQMFQRLHEVGRYEGSGIGLAIAKRIVERHGGRIWFESQPGVGTTFYVTLLAAPRR